jgi:hypothetical protein
MPTSLQPVLTELDSVTGASLDALRKGDFIADTAGH